MAMEKTSDRGRRSIRNILVDRAMQNRIAINIAAINLGFAGLGLYIMLGYVRELRDGILLIPSLSEAGLEQLEGPLVGLVTTAFVMVIVIVAANYLTGILLAHRFAGPAKVMVDMIDDMIQGRESRHRDLRPSDELKPVVAKLNELAETLKKSRP